MFEGSYIFIILTSVLVNMYAFIPSAVICLISEEKLKDGGIFLVKGWSVQAC